MGTLRTLNAEEAESRFDWLVNNAGIELSTAELEAVYQGPYPVVDAKVIEKLQEVARVARELAKHYGDRENEQMEWEISNTDQIGDRT